MSFHFEIRPVPPCDDPSVVRQYLLEQQELLLFLVKQLNHPGCGLYFDDSGRLAVNHGATLLCTTSGGLEVDPSQISHHDLADIAVGDDHPQYILHGLGVQLGDILAYNDGTHLFEAFSVSGVDKSVLKEESSEPLGLKWE